MESEEDRKKRMKEIYGDNESFNAGAARWPVFSQTKLHHTQLGGLMHSLDPKNKSKAFLRLKQRALDARIAQNLENMKDSNFVTGKDRDVLDRQTFKHLAAKDKKKLYEQYGFSSSSSDEEIPAARVKSSKSGKRK